MSQTLATSCNCASSQFDSQPQAGPLHWIYRATLKDRCSLQLRAKRRRYSQTPPGGRAGGVTLAVAPPDCQRNTKASARRAETEISKPRRECSRGNHNGRLGTTFCRSSVAQKKTPSPLRGASHFPSVAEPSAACSCVASCFLFIMGSLNSRLLSSRMGGGLLVSLSATLQDFGSGSCLSPVGRIGMSFVHVCNFKTSALAKLSTRPQPRSRPLAIAEAPLLYRDPSTPDGSFSLSGTVSRGPESASNSPVVLAGSEGCFICGCTDFCPWRSLQIGGGHGFTMPVKMITVVNK